MSPSKISAQSTKSSKKDKVNYKISPGYEHFVSKVDMMLLGTAKSNRFKKKL